MRWFAASRNISFGKPKFLIPNASLPLYKIKIMMYNNIA